MNCHFCGYAHTRDALGAPAALWLVQLYHVESRPLRSGDFPHFDAAARLGLVESAGGVARLTYQGQAFAAYHRESICLAWAAWDAGALLRLGLISAGEVSTLEQHKANEAVGVWTPLAGDFRAMLGARFRAYV